MTRSYIAAALVLLLAVPGAAQAPPPKQPSPEEIAPSGPRAIDVTARPILSFDVRDRTNTTFGALRFRSGLVLTSSWRGFGGLSALRLSDNGERFVALSDKGAWFTGRIVMTGREMTGLADVMTAPVLGPDGRPITTRGWFDTESLARDGDKLYVGIERVNQILVFDFDRDGVRAAGQPIALPTPLKKLPNNKGIESLAFVPPGQPLTGALIALSERGLDRDGNIIGALIGGPKPGPLAVRRTENFDISDAVTLRNGDLLILERKFSWLEGIAVRIRRIKAAAIAPNALLDGTLLFQADLGQEVDNLEGIDAHVTADGETVLTLVSDDNLSLLQRTLLLQFTLLE